MSLLENGNKDKKADSNKMYIDPTNIVNNTAGASAASLTKNDPRRKSSPAAKAHFGQSYQIIRRALQWEENTPAFVEQARSFIESGQADAIESARHTADTLLQYGI